MENKMAEGQSCEEIPYFKWKINDIDSKNKVKSPVFTVKGMKFRMVYHRVISSNLYEIYMEPEVVDSTLTIPSYCIAASVSIMCQDKECGDLRCTQQSLSVNPNSKGNALHHVLWLLRKKELLNVRDKIVGGKGINDVIFLCVFGQRSKYQKDVFEEEGTWCSKQCFLRLGKDLDKLRFIPGSSILLRGPGEIDKEMDKEVIKANLFILSARAEPFANSVRNEMVSKKEGIANIKFRCLENFITYLYSGRLKDCKPPYSVLIQLHEMAWSSKVDSLKEMVSFKLLEYINDPIFECSCNYCEEEKALGLSGYSPMVKKYSFGLGYRAVCMERFASDVLYILSEACRNEALREKILYCIAKDYGFILQTKAWETFFCEYHSLKYVSEVYRVFFQYVKKYRPRR